MLVYQTVAIFMGNRQRNGELMITRKNELKWLIKGIAIRCHQTWLARKYLN